MREIGVCALALVLAVSLYCRASAAVEPPGAPTLIWASDPVLPDETVLLCGERFGSDARVQVWRLPDAPSKADPEAAAARACRPRTVQPLQASERSLKFVLPHSLSMGVFACRVLSNDAASAPTLLNAPDPWWVQGDGGETASPGGWIRVFGKCLNFRNYAGRRRAPSSAAILSSARGDEIALQAREASCYALRFDLPQYLEPGRYTMRVHNGYGGPDGWRRVGTITIARPRPWSDRVFNAKELGFAQALQRARQAGGGVIYFPRGRYRMEGQVELPPGTMLRGEGRDLVNIYWPDMIEPPPALITGSGFAIEDLSIYCQGYYRNVIEAGADADGVRLRRLRVRANPFWRLGEPGEEVRGRVGARTVKLTGDGVVLRGRNFEITDCDILCAACGIRLEGARWGLIARNTVHYGTNGIAIEGSERIILEHNDIIGSDMAATGNYISTYGRLPAERIYYAHNHLANAYGYDRELMTFDGSGGIYFGAAAANGRSLILARDPLERSYATGGEPRPPADDSWLGAAVCILDGAGAGQYRRVVRHAGRRFEVDRPWDIKPDATSLFSIVPFRGRVLFLGNTLADGGAVQAFGTTLECVFAENCAERSSGFIPVWGYNGHDWGWQPSWFCQLLDNQILAGNEWGAGASRIATNMGLEQDRSYAGPLNRGVIIRRNIIHNNGDIIIGGVTHDVVVERCTICDTDRGISIAPEPRLVLLRRNRFHNVEEPLVGEGLAQALVIPAPK